MPTATTTIEDLIRRHADDVAYVAETPAATDLDTFIDQLGTAARHFAMAGINGHEDVETAALHLDEARCNDDDTDPDVFLRRASKLLEDVWEMTQEYREMVGD